MSDYKLKGGGVVRASDGAFIPLQDGNHDHYLYEQWLINGGVPDPEFSADEIKQQKIDAINREAGDRIIEIAPMYKQSNMLAHALELSGKATKTADEKAELAAMQAAWDQIKSIRVESNAKIAAL